MFASKTSGYKNQCEPLGSTLWFRRGFLAGKCNAGRVFLTHSKLSILRCEYKILLSPFVLASQNMRILAEFKLGEIRDRKTGQCLLRLDLSESNCCLNFYFTKKTYNGLFVNDKSLSQWCFLFLNTHWSVSNLGMSPLEATALYIERSVANNQGGDWKIWFLAIV